MNKRKQGDAKTNEQLNKADELELMCRGNGWRIAKEMLMKKIIELNDISTIDITNVTNLQAEVAGRNMAIATLFTWINEIDTTIKNKNAYTEVYKSELSGIYIDLDNK
jgi:hypothetical protein